MNSVLRLMRLCLLNIGRARRGLYFWQIDDYWPLGWAEKSEKELGSLGRVSALLSARALWLKRWCQTAAYLYAEVWAIVKDIISTQLNVFMSPLSVCETGQFPLRPSEMEQRLWFMAASIIPRLLFSPRCVFDMAGLHLSERCQLSDLIFTVHTERLWSGEPISDSSNVFTNWRFFCTQF